MAQQLRAGYRDEPKKPMNESLYTQKQSTDGDVGSAAKVQACETSEVNPRVWLTSAAGIMITGTFLRLYNLNLVPLHHDEGVNGNFLIRLVRDGFYQYDPQNYHGPTLYYFAALIPWISKFLFGGSFAENYGLSTFTIRFVTVAFGVATIWLVLTLRRRIGTIAALAGAALIAISPGSVYLSRYFIHETLLVFFTLGVVVATLTFYERVGPSYLLLAAASAALAFATKETAIVSAGVLVIALASTTLLARLRKTHEDEIKAGNGSGKTAPLRERVHSTTARFGGLVSLAILSMAALSLFLTIEILFYSSFFTNYPKGLYDAVKTFEFWAKTGTRDHMHPWSTYLVWMLKEEAPLMLLGLAGVVLAIWRGSNRFAVFAALWALGTFAAYSLIPYKTPWLMLNFLVPLAIMGGYAFEEIYKEARARKQPLAALAIGVVAFGVLGYQTLSLNFVHYDDETYIYSYVHTRRDFLRMVDQIDRSAERAGTGKQTAITVISREYWPLPWYLRHYPFVRYAKEGTVTDDPIIIGSGHQQGPLLVLLAGRYQQISSGLNPAGRYPLRPGVELVLFVRKDLATQLP
jgi:uncharacterized protein (TIGR03663 family)